MRKEFFKWAWGVILTALVSAGAMAQPGNASDDNKKKETIRIVVVDKKDGSKSGGESQKTPSR